MKPPVFAPLDLADALERSKAEKKLLLVDAAAEWCQPCKIIDQSSIPITLQDTVKVSGTTVEQVLDGTTPDGKTVAERSTEAFTTSGSAVTFTKKCDGSGSRTATFSATSKELTMFLVNDVGQTVAYEYR